MVAYDFVLAWLQHPYANNKGVCVRRNTLVRWMSGIWIELDGRSAFTQALHNLLCRNACYGWIESDEQVRYMVCNSRGDGLGCHGRNAFDCTSNQVGTPLIVALH